MINKVMLIGNLGKDPETKEFENGKSVTNFSMATSESYKDKDGEWQERTEWHDISAWQSMSAQKLSKGDTVYVEGKLTTRSWEDSEGNKRYKTEVNANYIRLVKRSGTQVAHAEVVGNDQDLELPRINPKAGLPF